MSQYVSPYSYRTPPDTFLYRRDPHWYIGAVTLSQAYKDQITLARQALKELATAAGFVKTATTDPGIEQAAIIALEWANVKGPARLDKAEQTGDPVHLAAVQTATKNIFGMMKQEQIPAAVSRFFAMVVLGPAGAVMSASQIDAAKQTGLEILEQITPNISLPPSKDIPLWVWAAGGLVGLVAVAYIVGKVKS